MWLCEQSNFPLRPAYMACAFQVHVRVGHRGGTRVGRDGLPRPLMNGDYAVDARRNADDMLPEAHEPNPFLDAGRRDICAYGVGQLRGNLAWLGRQHDGGDDEPTYKAAEVAPHEPHVEGQKTFEEGEAGGDPERE